jgi:putative ABC transport system permease protein
MIGVIATLFGLVSGSCMALVLTWIINRVFFGWSIDLAFPLASMAATPLWLLPAALVAALIPAWRAAWIPPARAVRFE